MLSNGHLVFNFKIFLHEAIANDDPSAKNEKVHLQIVVRRKIHFVFMMPQKKTKRDPNSVFKGEHVDIFIF